MADFSINGEARIDTSQAEKSAQGLTEKLGDAMDKGASKAGKASALISMGMNAISVAAVSFECYILAGLLTLMGLPGVIMLPVGIVLTVAFLAVAKNFTKVNA